MASPIQYALNNIGKKAQQLFNPVGQAISRVPQQFGNYIQKTPQYQGAQMYQRALQSPQVRNMGQQFLNAQRPSIQGLNTARQIVTPFVKANANILGQGLMSWQRSTPHGQAIQQLSQNLPTSSTNPIGNTYLKALAPFRKPTSIEDVGNVASAVYGAPKVVANTIGGGIGYGINKFTKEQSDANAFQGGYEFSSKIGGIGKLLETPLAPLVKRLNPTAAVKIGQLIDKGLTKEAFKQLMKNVGTSTITGGIEGGAFGAVQQAKNKEAWAKNIFDNATQFAAFSGGTSLVSGLGTIGAKTVWNKGGNVVRAGQNVLNKALGGKGMPSSLQFANAEINSPMDKEDVQAIFDIHKRASESWMTKNKKLDLNQHAKDMHLIDGMLVDNYGASVKEVKSMSAKEKIDTLYSIARQDSGILYSDVKLPTQVEGKYLYHGTGETALENIAKEGLKPGRHTGNISLSPNEAYAQNWAKGGITPQGKTEGVMLRVNQDLLKTKILPSKSGVKADQLNELISKEVIPPEALEIFKDGKWQPLKSLQVEGLAKEASKYKSVEEFVKGTHEVNISDIIPTKGHTAEAMKGKLPTKGYENQPIRVEINKEGKLQIQDGNRRYYQALARGDKKVKIVFSEDAPALNFNGEFDRIKNFFNQSKGVQNAELSFKLPVAPQVVNGKIKMRPITAPKLEGTADLTKNQVIEGLNNQSQSPLQSASGNRIPELQPKTQLLNKIDQLKQSAQQSIQEQRAFAQAKAQQLAGLSANDLKDLASLRKMVGSKAGQVGDIETLYAKNPKLMDRVLNRMREVTGDYQGTAKTDVELLDHALSLPTKGSIKIQQPSELKQIKALKEDAAIARDLVYHAEPIKRSQSKADLFDKDLKEWSDMVYKDAVASEKAKTIDAVNKLTSSIEESTNKSLRSKYVTTKAGKVVTSKTGSGVEKALLEESTTWKDKPKVLYIRETMDRNFEDVMGKDAPRMKEVFLNPIKSSEAERIRFLNRERASIKDLGIKARSKESGLVQQFGEKKLSAEQVLEQVGGDAKKADQIINASNVLRKKYDTYLTDINKVLTRNGYDPIPKRDDYFTHFQEVSSALERFGIPIRDNKLPTDINGLTADFKPGKNFFSNALPRLGDKTDIDAITGIDRYLEGASQQMYHTDNIQRLRLLEKSIRAKYEGTTHLSNFVTELSEYTNGIAGKKAMIDRAAEAMVGRNIYGAVNRLRSQVGANMVGANVSSALTNYIPLTQSLATTNKKSFVKGMMSTIGNVFKNDGFVDRSDFLTKRFGSDKLSMNLWDKAADKAGWFFKAVDHFTASTVVRSKFDEGIKMGLSPSKAMLRADNWAEKIIGGRSVGDMPTLFQSRTLGLFTQFQLEVNNQMSFMAKDIPRNFDKKGAAASLGQLFLYSYLFNNLYEKAVGRRPAFDPVGVAQKSYEDYTNPDLPKNQANINLLSNVAQNLPFSSLLEGGRIPMGSAMPNPFAIMKGESDLKTELSKPLWYIAPPFGGGQAKKTVEGIGAYNQGYSESKKGLIRFPIDKSPISGVKSALFGQWSGENSQKYIREGQNVLGKDQSANYKQLPPSDRQTYMDSVNQGRVQNRQIEKQKEEYDKTGSASPTNVKVLNDDVIKANLKYSKGNIYTTKDALFIKRPDTSVNKIPLTNELTGNAIQQAKQLATKESAIQSAGVAIYNRTDIPDWEKNEAYKALGTTAQDVEFRALKSLKDDQQATVLFNLLKERKWKQEKVDAFIKSDVLTNNVVGKMEDQGLINEAQAKDLKAYIKSTSIKLGKVSGSSKKAKKIKMPKLKAIKVKYSKLKIKIPKPKKYKSLLSKGRSNKYFK